MPDTPYTSVMDYRRHGRRPGPNVAELHTHVGAAVDPAILYAIAHDQGIRLPTNNYWEFVEMVTVAPERVKTFEEYLALFHWTELVQSSPEAMFASVASVIEVLKPQRIGHGIKAAGDARLLECLAERSIVLEICPTSNLSTGVVRSLAEFSDIFAQFHEFGVPYCLNTDGPEMLVT